MNTTHTVTKDNEGNVTAVVCHDPEATAMLRETYPRANIFPAVKHGTRIVLWKCGCGTKRVDYQTERTIGHVDRVWGHAKWNEPRVFRIVDGTRHDMRCDLVCPSCNRERKGAAVKGTVTDHKCNAKCLASTSGVCECSCGGANHGKSHL